MDKMEGDAEWESMTEPVRGLAHRDGCSDRPPRWSSSAMGAPGADISCPVTSGLLWCPHSVDKQTSSQGRVDRAPPPEPPTPAQFSPLLLAPVPELLLKPPAGMLPGVCV